MKLIFVPVADRPECIHALQASFWLARRVGASVQGCHIRPHTGSKVSLPEPGGDEQDTSWHHTYAHKYADDSHSSAESIFIDVAAQHDYELRHKHSEAEAAYWQEKVGSPAKIVAIQAPGADLTVVSRPKRSGSSVARLFVNAALDVHSTPVLILPQRKTANLGKRVSIAWNQSDEAARAVKAAMPILRRADEINIIVCGPESRLGPKSTQLKAYLKHWGVDAEILRDHKDQHTEEQIYSAYQESGSDLLIMGAYSRSRTREMIFGGVTEYMLTKANKASLFLHS